MLHAGDSSRNLLSLRLKAIHAACSYSHAVLRTPHNLIAYWTSATGLLAGLDSRAASCRDVDSFSSRVRCISYPACFFVGVVKHAESDGEIFLCGSLVETPSFSD